MDSWWGVAFWPKMSSSSCDLFTFPLDETGLPTVKCPKSRLVPWPEAFAGPRPFECDGRWACGNKRGTRWWYYFFRDKYGAPHKPCKIWEAKETSLKYSFVRQHGPIFVGPPGYGLRMPTFGPPADCVPMPTTLA